MAVTNVDIRKEEMTLVVTSEFDAEPEAVWGVWSDPRKLEKWWGPPSHPATFVEHALEPGGRIFYFMTGPEGDKYYGYWNVTSTDEPKSLGFVDGFADESGAANTDLPETEVMVTFASIEGGRTRMDITSTYATVEAMEQVLEMGMVEGISQALGQVDALL